MHAMGGEQDMRRMGGLRKAIPWTFGTMLAATLAIAGTPGFSGFFSKDAILLAANEGPYANPFLYWLGVLTAGLTAFYMFRLLFLTFYGAPRYDPHHTHHVHESPRNMLVPLVLLAILSVGGGWWAAPHLFGGTDLFTRFLGPVFGVPEAAAAKETGGELLAALLGAPVIAGLIGFFAAWWLYIRRPELPDRIAESLSGVYRLLSGKYFIDELYAAVIVRPLLWISTHALWHGIDERLIDGTVNGIGREAESVGERVRHLNSGNTRTYATWVVFGAVLLTLVLVWMAG
jgi:NADH-quinone oxidoreductase subunit L